VPAAEDFFRSPFEPKKTLFPFVGYFLSAALEARGTPAFIFV
jgi:hypothetical protein